MEAAIINALAHLEECCRQVARDTADLLVWRWDDYIGAMLAEFKIDQADRIAATLDTALTTCWDHQSIDDAPADVAALADRLSGLRWGQRLYVSSDPVTPVFAAWWPWGDEETISVRIGIDVPADQLPEIHQLLEHWFNEPA